MANYVLIDKEKEEQDRAVIAQSIKNKAGIYSTMTWPNGFVDTVNNIQTGGGGKPEQAKTVSYTSNGRKEIYPDSGYTMSSCIININVPTSGGIALPGVGSVKVTELVPNNASTSSIVLANTENMVGIIMYMTSKPKATGNIASMFMWPGEVMVPNKVYNANAGGMTNPNTPIGPDVGFARYKNGTLSFLDLFQSSPSPLEQGSTYQIVQLYK